MLCESAISSMMSSTMTGLARVVLRPVKRGLGAIFEDDVVHVAVVFGFSVVTGLMLRSVVGLLFAFLGEAPSVALRLLCGLVVRSSLDGLSFLFGFDNVVDEWLAPMDLVLRVGEER